MKLVLIGDGESPHLVKWARALEPRLELYAASSRGFAPALAELLPPERRLALNTRPNFAGGNTAVLRSLPRLGDWLKTLQPDWLHAHYLTSHGTLAVAAKRVWGLQARIAGSAWGSDILVAPDRSVALRWLTRRVLRACTLCTSDSLHMAERMRALGAREVMSFPFGLETLPPPPGNKSERLFFANRGLEPIYAPDRVLAAFTTIARDWPDAELVLANDGSLRPALEQWVQGSEIAGRVRFVGRLDADAQARWYANARWYFSLPHSDSVSVSVLEAMAYGCVPILSDLPANRELVNDGDNGLILADGRLPDAAELHGIAVRADRIALANHGWVARQAMFEPAVERFVARLHALQAGHGLRRPRGSVA
ncbi:glycosyltransferase [Aquincola sp. S2]|uniref:Glycosyltransferase n=1 Tax=Pseudaquabacterium terrae TaxID=2732868 RepID=A0ABX2EDV0_9BURK|nr:glycosyltransferase [Aquabacterium terrae]NRF66794.1 glycosyltransferase [Aquabacterium terrae]